MKPGVYQNLSNEEYHKHKESISRSALMDFSKSPFNYWAKHLNPERVKRQPTPQMIFGSAFHTMILEPEKCDTQYIVKPNPVLLKDVGREAYDSYKRVVEDIDKSGLTVLSVSDINNLKDMRAKLKSNETAIQLIANARIENSFFWEDKHSGLLLKARPDILHDNMIVDLKTCSDASERTIQNEVFKYGYDVQMSMIRDGVEQLEGNRIENFVLICIETKYPYAMGIYILDKEIIDNAQDKYKNLLLRMKECRETNSYTDYGIQTLYLPKWALNE